MIPNDFSIGKLANSVFTLPSFRFRDKDATTHNAGDSTKCGRQVTYKALKTKESNPVDTLGQLRMRFGSWIERGLTYDIMNKMGLFGVLNLGGQGDTGEHGTFYGTSWHGYRDLDVALRQIDGKWKPVIVEIKTKVGFGAGMTIKKTPFSKEFKTPMPDTVWGYAQQLSLYLRDAYRKTVNNPKFSVPIVDGILLQLLYADGLACFVEYFAEYKPETDSVHYYRVHCEEYPQISATIDLTIKLEDVAKHWAAMDVYLAKGELAPPAFERRYSIEDERLENATKKDLELAKKNKLLIGDMQCKYCSFRDKCAEDLKIPLNYSGDELAKISSILKNK